MTDLPYYDEIHQLAVGLVNASELADSRAEWSLYSQLDKLCDGQQHPFPWETLADFTPDDRAALKLYAVALGHARKLRLDEYAASIELSIAERFLRLGEHSLAIEHVNKADEIASRGDDLELRHAISQFRLDCSSNGC